MANNNELDPADKTPFKVIQGIENAHKPYKSDECIPCGAVVKMGFFFDAFGRSRDLDDKTTSRYSNICRLWEAHRDNDDDRRKKQPNQFWYPFYYSGLGTPLNDEARNSEIVAAATRAGAALGKSAMSSAKGAAKKVVGLDKLEAIKNKPANTVKTAGKEMLSEMSWRPAVSAFHDLVAQAKAAPKTIGKVLAMAEPDRWAYRVKGLSRKALYDIKKNPLIGAWKLVKSVGYGVGAGLAMEAIPQVRDSPEAAVAFGTGVDDRLYSALKQFEAAYQDVKGQMHKIQRIEVSVFGADRGCVLARAFVNELVSKYQDKNGSELRIGAGTASVAPIKIKILGLLDAVSSFMAENKLVDLVPLPISINQNYGGRALGVPSAVERCVHFAAAHELRFYQRLDSLEKTRGKQYLYPGTSEDVTGGSPPSSLGMRAELQRFVLRDMLNEALVAGSAMDRMEDLAERKPDVFRRFSLATPITEGKTSYKIGDLVDAYRKLVPYKEGLDFQAHMRVFLQWLAIRYQSPGFRDGMQSMYDKEVAAIKARWRARAEEHNAAQAAYMAERARNPRNPDALLAAQHRLRAAERDRQAHFGEGLGVITTPVVAVWQRLEQEAAEQMALLDGSNFYKPPPNPARDKATAAVQANQTYPARPHEPLAPAMTKEARALAQAWKDAADGKQKLDEKVVALFDLLVHDTMLTSWHDHVLSGNLYFQTRATDTFGVSDQKKEAAAQEARRKDAELRQKRADAVRRARDILPGRGVDQFKAKDGAQAVLEQGAQGSRPNPTALSPAPIVRF